MRVLNCNTDLQHLMPFKTRYTCSDISLMYTIHDVVRMKDKEEKGIMKKLERYPNRKYTEVTYSLPKEIVKRIDAERGDVSRNRFVLRLIEKGYTKED